MWITSFKRVNLHPSFRLNFKEWTEKIAGFLEAGSIYKNFNPKPSALELFSLLPSFWWGVNSENRQNTLDISRKYGDRSFSLECTDEMHRTLHIPYADMDNLRVCVYIAEEHPETINYPVGEPNWNEVKKVKMGESYTAEVVKNKDDVNLNLNAFQRIQKIRMELCYFMKKNYSSIW